MMWIIYSFLVALFNTAKSVASKKSLQRVDEYVVSWMISLFPALLASAYLVVPLPPIQPRFYSVLLLNCSLSMVATVLFVRALKSDLSATIPMTAFTPLFMLATSFLMLGEFPDAMGVLGVVLIVLGAYCLNLKERKDGWKMPFRALVRSDGPKYMLGAAFIWSITANLDKMAIQDSGAVFFALIENVVMALMFLPLVGGRLRREKERIWEGRASILAVGVFSTFMIIFQMLAIAQTLAVYVIAIKRLTILLSILAGGVLFREKDIRTRLVGGAIMVVGVLFITVF
jgi:drug/metabolite transporter (DMT)-like permease